MADQDGDSFDYIVVGSGAAGSVLANRLTEDPGSTVCVLECGPPDRHPYIHIPAGFIKTLNNPNVNWMYESELSEWTGGRQIPVPRGKTLGGSGSINGHIYNRGQRRDFDDWAAAGCPGWDWRAVAPVMQAMEELLNHLLVMQVTVVLFNHLLVMLAMQVMVVL